jgi:hypothetical protein
LFVLQVVDSPPKDVFFFGLDRWIDLIFDRCTYRNSKKQSNREKENKKAQLCFETDCEERVVTPGISRSAGD